MVAESRLPIAVVEAIATSRGVEPLDLEFSLHEWIDGDVLNALSGLAGDDWRFAFTVDGQRVTVEGDGSIFVDGTRISGLPNSRE
ncbi:HalOD1 output domain-containing protein [Halobaculum lipolyticum]|uniref:HalOD1 output domain-containing protein n=1 Tax=Halobaculum lipolyticum TaxID=3032001 RepID=A0ABD5W6S8_9EURY|nr:HalOD1 output domain-containing protein [Halobaculum sp. DT31]